MTQKQTLSDRKRAAIIDAAVAEFKANGFSSTSMDTIAATASVSKRTVYNHFDNKEALFGEILNQLWQRSTEKNEYPYQAGIEITAQLSKIVAAELVLLSSSSYLDLARAVLAEMIHSPDRAREIIEQMSEKKQGLKKWLRAAIENDQLVCSDIELASQQLHSLINGFAFWPQVTMGQACPDEQAAKAIVDATVEMFLSRYRKKE